MIKDLAEIYFVMDMTGSMQPLKVETVINFNNFIEEQKKVPGKARMSLVTFNSMQTKKVYDRIPLEEISAMQQDDYNPDGMTPLLDTIGNSINEFGEVLKSIPEENRPEKVIFVILTDGEENFSRKFKRQQIFEMITHQKDVYQWEFLFFGANIDVYAEAGRIGIDQKQAFAFDTSSAKGYATSYAGLSASVTRSRTERKVD